MIQPLSLIGQLRRPSVRGGRTALPKPSPIASCGPESVICGLECHFSSLARHLRLRVAVWVPHSCAHTAFANLSRQQICACQMLTSWAHYFSLKHQGQRRSQNSYRQGHLVLNRHFWCPSLSSNKQLRFHMESNKLSPKRM